MGSGTYFDYPGGGTEAAHGATDVAELVFLRGWTDADWDLLLPHTQMHRFAAGDALIRAGHTDRALYLVTAGRLEVRSGEGRRRQRLAVIEPNSVVGEQAFLDGDPASADVVALTDGQALRLSPMEFEVFAARHPELGRSFLFGLGEVVSRRLRATTQTLLRRR